VCQRRIYTKAHLGLCPGKIHVVKAQLEYFHTSTTQCKQLSLFNCSASAPVAAAKRTNTASGGSLKYTCSKRVVPDQGFIYWGGQGGSFPPKEASFPPKEITTKIKS